jgi:hypothetical protein
MKTETSLNYETPPSAKPLLYAGLSQFHQNFKNGNVYLEDSVLWYCLDMGIDWYLGLSIHQRINFKQSYFDMACS